MSNRKGGSRFEMDMCSGSVLKKMLLFALPLMCSSILQLLFNAADIIVVGQFAGDDSLAAVGSTTSLINLLTNLFVGLSVAANVLVARFYGAQRQRDLKITVHTSMTVSIVGGLALTVIGVAATPAILELMQSPPEVLELAVIYLRIYFLGMPAMMIYNFGSAILRAVGDTRRPLYFLFASGVVNVVLNLVFVICCHMGVMGVAIATVISQTISAACILWCMVREEGGMHLDWRSLGIDRYKLVRLLKIGLPAGIQGMLFSLSNVCIQSSVNAFGATIVAGNSAASNIEGFVYVAMNAFYQATISFTSQNVGARRYERVNRILWTAQGCVIAVGVLLGVGAWFFNEPLLGLYTNSAQVVEAGRVRLSIIAIPYALCGMMEVVVGSLRGLGKSVMPMIVSLMGACVFRLVWLATVFQIQQFHTIEVIYISYPISWILTTLVHFICFIIIRRKLAKQWGC